MLFISQLLFISSLFFFGYVVGKTILKNFSFSYIEEACAFSVSAGWSFLVFLLMFIGFFGYLKPFIFFSISVVVLMVCLCAINRNKRHNFKEIILSFKNKFHSSSFVENPIIILPYFILIFYLAAYPITEWDAVSYHLPLAKQFTSQGKITYVPFVRFPVGPQVMDLFFTTALMLNQPLFANLIQFALAIVLFLLIYSFGKRYLNKEVGLFSGFLFLSSPIVLKSALVPYAEIGATFFCFSAFYAMCLWITEEKLSYAILSAIFWGLAIGSKYYAIPFFLVSFLAIIILFYKKVKFSQGAYIVLLSLLIAFPWYFRNWIYTGDWFFPLRPISGAWHSLDVTLHWNYLRSFGMGRDIKSLFMLPINLLRHSNAFQENIGSLIIGIGSVLFIKKLSYFIKLCAIVILFYCLFWFYSFQVSRYLFPIFPLLSLLGGWLLQQVNDFLNIKKQWFWTFSIITVLLLGYFNCVKMIRNNGSVPLTVQQQSEYLARRIPTFKAINFLNNIGQSDEIVYQLFDEGSVFYYKNKVIGDWYGFAAYRKVSFYIDNPEILHKVLTEYGAKYFLVRRKERLQINQSLFESNLFKLLYSDQNAYVFEVLST